MIVAISRITVTNGNDEGLAAQYARRSGLVDTMPGFISMEVLRHAERPQEFLVYTRWETREAFEAYYKAQQFRMAHQNVANIPGGIKIDRHTRILDIYEVVTD
jgi:heme-degrading monooxygenase HmoA